MTSMARAIAIGTALLAPPAMVGTALLNVLDASDLAVGLFLLGLVIVVGITSAELAERTARTARRDHPANPRP